MPTAARRRSFARLRSRYFTVATVVCGLAPIVAAPFMSNLVAARFSPVASIALAVASYRMCP